MAAVPKEFPYTWMRFYREEARLTQDDLGKAIKKSKVAMNHFERGRKRPSAATAELIADELNKHVDMEVTVDDVFPTNGMYEPKQLMRMYLRSVRKREGRPAKNKGKKR